MDIPKRLPRVTNPVTPRDGVLTWTAADDLPRPDGVKVGDTFTAHGETGPVTTRVSGTLLTAFGDHYRLEAPAGALNPGLVRDPVWQGCYTVLPTNANDLRWPHFSQNLGGTLALDAQGRVVDFEVTSAPNDPT